MRSLDKVLANRNGLVPGLAPLQFLLVLVLIGIQSVAIGGGGALMQRVLWILPALCTGALSCTLGFAAAAARARTVGRRFVTDQLRLAAPIYVFAVMAVLLALGPAMTDGSIRRYFTNSDTPIYLLNLIGWPHYTLPGVFEFNDLPGVVNRNVWVMPFVVLIVAVVAIGHGARFRRLAVPGLALAFVSGAVLCQALDIAPDDLDSPFYLALRSDGLSAILGGAIGAMLFNERRWVPLGPRLAIGAAVAVAGVAVLGNAGWADMAVFRIVIAIPVAYLTLYTAMRPPAIPAAFAHRFMRYLPGLYLLSFPLQQVAAQIVPLRSVAINLAIGVVSAGALAAAFWYLIGRRLLSADQLAVAAASVVTAGDRRDRRRRREISPIALLGYAALVLFVIGVAIGIAALVYIAMLPETGAI